MEFVDQRLRYHRCMPAIEHCRVRVSSRWTYVLWLLCCVFLSAVAALAQGGPPMRTDDPGTPGNGNVEINLAVTSDRRADERVLEAPLVDINYGLGERIQLKVEVPFVIQG